MKQDALTVAKEGLESCHEEKDVSAFVKVRRIIALFLTKHLWQRYFDKKYGPTWHCIVGSDFRAFVTHESKHFIFFYVG